VVAQLAASAAGAGLMIEQDRVFAKAARRLIPLMIALYTVSYLDRVNVSFAALTMNRDLGFTPQIYGWGAGIFFFGYFLFEVPSNVILTHVGARVWICRIMASWGVISAANAFVQGPLSFYGLRFLLGLAEAGFAPGMIFYLSLWFPKAVRARYAAAYFLAIPLTNVIGAPVSSLILEVGLLGLKGWQWLFIVEAIPALVLAVAVFFLLPDGPKDARWLSPSERDVIESALATEKQTGEEHIHSVWSALKDKRVMLLCAVYFAIVVGLYGIGYWLPQIVQGMGFSNFAIGLLVALPYAAAGAAQFLWGRHSDNSGERIWHVALPSLMSAVAFALSAVLAAPFFVLIALAFAAIGICATLAPFWAMPPQFLSGRGAAAGIAAINAVGNLGGFIGPYAVGWALAVTGSYAGGMLILALSLLAGAGLVLAMGRFKRATLVLA
jgi:ACS family tartrate transporter-like MFS transporter